MTAPDARWQPGSGPEGIEARVIVRPIASPLPLGFFTAAIDSAVVGCLDLGVFPAQDRREVAYIVFPAFVLQLVVAIFCLLGRDSVATTAMASMATTWLVNALVLSEPLTASLKPLGVFYLAFGIFAALMVVVAYRRLALGLVLGALSLRFLLAGAALISGNTSLLRAAGVVAMVVVAVAVYAAFALLLEETHGRAILPIGRSGQAARAMADPVPAQLAQIQHEAGVRRML